jgi:hypothetical protein
MKLFSTAILAVSLMAGTAYAGAKIQVMKSDFSKVFLSEKTMVQMVQKNLNLSDYRQAKTKLVLGPDAKPDHILVYLSSAKYHKLSYARLNLDKNLKVTSVVQNYQPQSADYDSLKKKPTTLTCPDPSVEFIAFAPNDMDLEQQITVDVAQAAEAAGLKTVRLLKDDATRDAYLNYMTCPRLKGNFYDGDANPEEFITVDGVISADDMKTLLKGQFQYKVTNIWLACEAYNDPMLSAVVDDAQSQKYAAGINNLLVGPSDRAAACTMKAAIQGQPMQASFDACYKQFDSEEDQWGFSGKGSDYFGQ